MKKWFIALAALLTGLCMSQSAQADVHITQETPSSLAIQAVSFSGDEMIIKTTISNPENVFGYDFLINYDPAEYEFVSSESGGKFVLASEYGGPGKVGVASVTLTDSRGNKNFLNPEVSLVFRKKTEAWGELKPSDLEIHTLDKQSQVTQSLPAFVPRPSTINLPNLENYPNPFNPSTEIRFDLLNTVTDVQLIVYDMLGREVRVVANGKMPTGHYNIPWDGKDEHGQQVGSGVYFYRLKSGDWSITRKMTLLK